MASSTQTKTQTCTGFDPRKIYMLGEKYSGLKPRGVLQNYSSLKKHCVEHRKLFEDPLFPPGQIEMSENEERMTSKIEWLRPREIMANPKFISQGTDRFDVNQGYLGDCWFLAAVANITQNHNLLELVVPKDQFFHVNYAGIFHFRFWQYGRWIDIVVDDRLPTYKGKPIYLKSKQPNEFWTPLLEKAYAKLYGSYKNIEGGFVSEALEDLTGGLAEIFTELTERNKHFNFFDMMLMSYQKQSFMGCSIMDSQILEGKRSDGLYTRHAYSVTRVAEVGDKEGSNVKLVRIRNPWGRCEWKGNWSDNSKNWEILPDATRNQLLAVKDDGEFWMQFDDFIKTYTLLEFCHPNPDSLRTAQEEMRHWNSFIIDGAWISGVTGGGLPNHSNFSRNPQYLLTLNGPEKNKNYRVLVALTQKNRRIHKLPELPIGFVVYQLTPPIESGRLNQDFLTSTKPIYVHLTEAAKQVTGHMFLIDGINGSYCIIPHTEHSKDTCDFLLRVYCEVEFNVVEHADEIRLTNNKALCHSDQQQNADAGIKQVFQNFAGQDEQIDWVELKKILDLLSKKDNHQFSKEICRSMLALMDTDLTGKLNFHEFFQLWEQIGKWRGVFRIYDQDQSNTMSAQELLKALKEAGIQVNNRILNILVLRYGNAKGELEMEDFLCCCIKLNTIIGTYFSKYGKDNKLEDWIIDTIYT